jgi:hypothetical protein
MQHKIFQQLQHCNVFATLPLVSQTVYTFHRRLRFGQSISQFVEQPENQSESYSTHIIVKTGSLLELYENLETTAVEKIRVELLVGDEGQTNLEDAIIPLINKATKLRELESSLIR